MIQTISQRLGFPLLLLTLVLTGCYRGPYQFAYLGQGKHKDVAECIVQEMGATTDPNETALFTPYLKMTSTTEETSLHQSIGDADVSGNVINGVFIPSITNSRMVHVLTLRIRQKSPDTVLAILDHDRDWTYAAATGLDDLANKYVPNCLENSRLFYTR